MRITFQGVALSTAALTLAGSAIFAAPVSAKMTKHSKRHHVAARHQAMHHSAKGSMKGSATGTTGTGNANPAMSTAPATSGGDKP